jgi:hypothetical protein
MQDCRARRNAASSSDTAASHQPLSRARPEYMALPSHRDMPSLGKGEGWAAHGVRRLTGVVAGGGLVGVVGAVGRVAHGVLRLGVAVDTKPRSNKEEARAQSKGTIPRGRQALVLH